MFLGSRGRYLRAVPPMPPLNLPFSSKNWMKPTPLSGDLPTLSING